MSGAGRSAGPRPGSHLQRSSTMHLTVVWDWMLPMELVPPVRALGTDFIANPGGLSVMLCTERFPFSTWESCAFGLTLTPEDFRSWPVVGQVVNLQLECAIKTLSVCQTYIVTLAGRCLLYESRNFYSTSSQNASTTFAQAVL